MTRWLRYGWPRRVLLRAVDRMPQRMGDRLLDFLYPDDLQISVRPVKREGMG